MKLTKITNDRLGHIILEYNNKEILSLLWAPMSYSDNYYKSPGSWEDISDLSAKEVSDKLMKLFEEPQESSTVELMSRGEIVEQAIKDKGWDNPTWMTPLEDLLDLLIELRRV